MRLDKFLSNNTAYSRTDIRKLVKGKRVSVNHQPASNAASKVIPTDVIDIDGVAVRPLGKRYFMLNKPEGYVCTNKGASHPTVIDLFMDGNALEELCEEFGSDPHTMNAPAIEHELQIAGRLDLDTTGLVLLTNDGDWNHRVTSPSALCKKTYLVTLDQPLSSDTAERFAEGLLLDSETKKTRPAQLDILTPNQVRLSIAEGKYHQVKRMFAAVGNHVVGLHRESIAGITLDPELAPGQSRALSQDEVNSIDTEKEIAGKEKHVL